MPRARRANSLRTFILYTAALLREFRWTFLVLALILSIGAALYLGSSERNFGDHPRTPANAFYAAWMAMLAQPIYSPPPAWQIKLLCVFYPVLGATVIGEGVVRLALLMFSRRHGEKGWTKVVASTYRDHAVICGIGKLGIRVMEQFVAANVPVVCIERDESNRFNPVAKKAGVPVIFGDMKDDATLIAAGIPHASVVLIATNDDIANLEVALDSRRLNPKIRVVMRLFEQSVAQKISNAFLVDAAFSSTTLAAPMVAAMSLGTRVLATTMIANVPHVTMELKLEPGAGMVGKRIAEAERAYGMRVLARTPVSGTAQLQPDGAFEAGDTIVVSAPSTAVATISIAGRP